MSWGGFIILAAAAAAAIIVSRFVRKSIRRLLAALDPIARRPAVAIATCGLLSAAGSLTTALVFKWPEPLQHDEFCYLLAADTFAQGRLTNPTHPMWRFFETFHVIHEPSYASKFPPAQGLFLAAGQVVFGHPIAGLWMSGALMAAAICWMLYGFLPRRWALIGGLLATARFGVATYWTQSYWGGAVAALGGALVFGATPRIARRPAALDATLFALGAAILANSRPFEGLVAVLSAAIVLAARLFERMRTDWRTVSTRVAVPVLAVLVPVGAWMAVYNTAVTGDPVRFPYQVYDDANLTAPVFLWMKQRPMPAYRHEVIRVLDGEQLLEPYLKQQTLSGFLDETWGKAAAFWRFFVGPCLSLSLLALPWVLRRRWMRFACATLALVAMALLGETYFKDHYVAPVAGLIVLVLAAGLRVIASWRPGRRPVGAAVACAIVLIELASLIRQARELRHPPPAEWRRAAVLADLEATGERHLVVVRYGPNHVPNFEWVYNAAEIDLAPVVWARDMGEVPNRPLLEYFAYRQVSLLEVGFTKGPPVLKPYPK